MTSRMKLGGYFRALWPTYLLDVLQRDPVLSQLLVDKHEGVEVTYSPVQQLIGKITRAFHHRLVELQQPGRKE